MSLRIRRLVTAGLCLAAGLAGTVLVSPAAHAAPPLSGKQIISEFSPMVGGSTKTLSPKCPAGKVVISGGALVDGPRWVQVNELQPVPTGNLFKVTARNPHGRDRWRLYAYALCANRPAGLEYKHADSQPQAYPSRIAVAICSPGKQVIGIGGLAALEPGRNVALNVVVPPGAVQTSWVKSTPAQGGEPLNWTTRSFAVCADALGATTVWVSGNPASSVSTRSNFASCPAGRLSAMGGMVGGDDGQVTFSGIYPDAAFTTGSVFMGEDWDGYGGTWALDAWALCA